jgi:UDP-N-acetylglucosamine 4,6-dehydratase/5-epimerase
VFVAKMPALNVQVLAEVMIAELADGDVEIEYVGTRLGEKLYEELIAEYEVLRALETDELLVVLPPAEASGYEDAPTPADFPGAQPASRRWHSGQESEYLSAAAIRELLGLAGSRSATLMDA